MNRDEQEMALWCRAYDRLHSRSGYAAAECGNIADFAVAEFRKRYPTEPTAPEPTAPGLTWYDEPPFAKDGPTRPCWIAGEPFPCAVYWSGHEWRVYVTGDSHVQRLNGRRVCPIAKPPEPTT